MQCDITTMPMWRVEHVYLHVLDLAAAKTICLDCDCHIIDDLRKQDEHPSTYLGFGEFDASVPS